MSVNKVILVGRLGRDPELRFTNNGTAVCNLSIATDYQPAQGEKRTEWHRVTVWSKPAEACGRYLTKGREVYVEGRLETRQYEKDGEKRYATEVVAERVQFLGGGKENAPAGANTPPDDDDVPF